MNDAFRVISFLLSAPLQEEISYITFSPHSSSILFILCFFLLFIPHSLSPSFCFFFHWLYS